MYGQAYSDLILAQNSVECLNSEVSALEHELIVLSGLAGGLENQVVDLERQTESLIAEKQRLKVKITLLEKVAYPNHFATYEELESVVTALSSKRNMLTYVEEQCDCDDWAENWMHRAQWMGYLLPCQFVGHTSHMKCLAYVVDEDAFYLVEPGDGSLEKFVNRD